jgi:hypothetical protein
MAVDGIICQGCGIEAPARYVEFHQNIGALLLRFSSATKGNLCKKCVHAHFWKRTLVTIAIGWLGTISIILAPVFVVMNIVRYIMVLGMPPVPAGAAAPVLTQQAMRSLGPHATQIVDRLNRGEALVAVASDIAPRVGVTPGQVLLYVSALARASRQPAVERTYGFPVLPPAAAPPPVPVLPVPGPPMPPPSPGSGR